MFGYYLKTKEIEIIDRDNGNKIKNKIETELYLVAIYKIK
jgi:hypothetical protein